MSTPKISPAAQAERNLARLAAVAQDHADPRLDDLRERLAGLAEDLAAQEIQKRNLAHNLAARLDNLAGALAELQADLVAGHKHRPRLAELAGYWAKIAAECSANAQELKEAAGR